MQISFVVPYYNNSHHFARQLVIWRRYPSDIRSRLQFVVIDDGSPKPLAIERPVALNLSVYRILEDVGWNNGGARNLGVHVAKTPWVFLCDIDHFVSPEMCAGMLALDSSDAKVFYTFESARDGRPQVPPPNIFLIHRQQFLDLGGYDEDLSGHYGGEDILLRKLMHRQLRHVATSLVLDAPDETVYDPPAVRGDRTCLEINDKIIQGKLAVGEYRAERPRRFTWKQAAEFAFAVQDKEEIPATRLERGPQSSADAHRRYRDACRQIDQGRYEEGRRLLFQFVGESCDPKLRALGFNDLATLDVIAGNVDEGRKRFRTALKLDPGCLSAAENLKTLSPDSANGQWQDVGAPSNVVEVTPANVEKPLRVVVLSFLFNWPSTGGGIMHTVGLIEALKREGHHVTHIFARKLDIGIGQCDDTCPISSTVLDFENEQWRPDAIQRRFREAVDAATPDVVLITDAWNFKPLLAEAVRGYRYVLRFDALECICPLNNIRLLPAEGGFRQCHRSQLATPEDCRRCVSALGQHSGVLHRLERELSSVDSPDYHGRLLKAIRQSSAVLAVNPVIGTLLEPYADRVLVVPAGIDSARFPTHERRPSDLDVVTLLFAGSSNDPIKGFDVLHDACKLLWKRRQDFELLVTGSPPGRRDDFTWFLDWQTQDEMVRHFRVADMVIIPSICQEAMPLVAMEAMGASCPVIASRIGGLPFSIVEGSTGLLFEPGDVDDLASQIETLLDDPERRTQMAEAGRRRFVERFTWDAVMRRHYRPLLQEFSLSRPAHRVRKRALQVRTP